MSTTAKTQSHYANYLASWNKYNGGDYLESRIAAPGSDLNLWAQETGDTLSKYYHEEGGLIDIETKVEPYAVNVSESGTPLGDINFTPYPHRCPQ